MEQVKWNNIPRFSLLLAVFFLASFSSWANEPETMTDLEILTELIQLQEQKEIELTQRETALISREQSLNQREMSLDWKENELNEREAQMIALQSFSQSLRKELAARRNSDYWRGFAHGSVAGFALGAASGGYLGFRLGISY